MKIVVIIILLLATLSESQIETCGNVPKFSETGEEIELVACEELVCCQQNKFGRRGSANVVFSACFWGYDFDYDDIVEVLSESDTTDELSEAMAGTDIGRCQSALQKGYDLYCDAFLCDVTITKEYLIFEMIRLYLDNGGDFSFVPPLWSCEPYRFNNGDCDCGCGFPDPDCVEKEDAIDACYFDDVQGICGSICIGQACIPRNDPLNYFDSIPVGWDVSRPGCDLCGYNSSDGCHCGCGAYDPDCDEPSSAVYNCYSCFDTCSSEGECVTGIPVIPDEWFCPDCAYNTSDGCNCGCGAWDPDCEHPDNEIIGCEYGEICDMSTSECSGTAGELSQWTCWTGAYNASDCVCDCDCGLWDPDCDATDACPKPTVRGCFSEYYICELDDGTGQCAEDLVDFGTLDFSIYYEIGDYYKVETLTPGEGISYNPDTGLLIYTYGTNNGSFTNIENQDIESLFSFLSGIETSSFEIKDTTAYVLHIQYFLYDPVTILPYNDDYFLELGFSSSFTIPVSAAADTYSEWSGYFIGHFPKIIDTACFGNAPILANINEDDKIPYIEDSTGYYLQFDNVSSITLELLGDNCSSLFIFLEGEQGTESINSITLINPATNKTITITSMPYDRDVYSFLIGDFFRFCCHFLSDIYASESDIYTIKFDFTRTVKSVFVDTDMVFARYYPFATISLESHEEDFFLSVIPAEPAFFPGVLMNWAYRQVRKDLPEDDLFRQYDAVKELNYNAISVIIKGDFPSGSVIVLDNINPSFNESDLKPIQGETIQIDDCQYSEFTELATYLSSSTGSTNIRSVGAITGALVSMNQWKSCYSAALDGNENNQTNLPDVCIDQQECLQYYLQSIARLDKDKVLCAATRIELIDRYLPGYTESGYYPTPTQCITNCVESTCIEQMWTCLSYLWGDEMTEQIEPLISTATVETDATTFYSDFKAFIADEPYFNVYDLSERAANTILTRIGRETILCENLNAVIPLDQYTCNCYNDDLTYECNDTDTHAGVLNHFSYFCHLEEGETGNRYIFKTGGGYNITLDTTTLSFVSTDCDFIFVSLVPKEQFDIKYQPVLSSVAVNIQPDKFRTSTYKTDDEIIVGEIVEDGFTMSTMLSTIAETEICVEFETIIYERTQTGKYMKILSLAVLQETDLVLVYIAEEGADQICFSVQNGTSELTYFPVALLLNYDTISFISTWKSLDIVLFVVAIILDVLIILWASYNFFLFAEEYSKGEIKKDTFWDINKTALFLQIILLVVMLFYFSFLGIGSFESLSVLNYIVADIPYLIFQGLFTIIVVRWIQIFHFAMKQKSKESKAVKTILYTINGVAYLLNLVIIIIYLYVYFNDTEIVSSCEVSESAQILFALSIIYKSLFVAISIGLAVLFLVYGLLLWNKLNETVNSTNKNEKKAKQMQKLLIITSFISLFLISQSTLSIISAVLSGSASGKVFDSHTELILIILFKLLPGLMVVFLYQKKSLMNRFDKRTGKTKSKTKSMTNTGRNTVELDSQ